MRSEVRKMQVGFVGNCQAELLRQVFHQTALDRGVNTFYHFFDLPEPRLQEARAEMSKCDILLLQDIAEVEHYPLRDSIPSHARVIEFPCLRFAAPWPYDDFNGRRDSVARAQDDPAFHTTIYYDGMLGRLRQHIPEPGARLDAYRTLSVSGVIDPLRMLDFEARRLRSSDERFGTTIGRRILSEFRDRQLFYTVNRPCGELLGLVMDYIVNAIELDVPIPSRNDLDTLRSIQVPVHPLIADRLGIAWADETTTYETNGQRVTWENHVRRYIERYG